MTESVLLEKLLANGVLTQDQINSIKIESSQTGKSYETILIEANYANEEQIVKAKGSIFNIPFINLDDIQITNEAFALLSVDIMRTYKLIPFAIEGLTVKVAMSDPFDVQAIEYVKNILSQYQRFDIFIAIKDQILEAIDHKGGPRVTQDIKESLEDVENTGEYTKITDTGDIDASKDDLANAPVAKIVNSIIEFAAKTKASDIHLEPLEDKTRVRYRINGILVEKLSLPKKIHSALIARIKIMAKLKIDIKKAPQDGRIPMKYKDKSFDLRVSTLPAIYGEKVVMRLHEKGTKIPLIEDSGLRGPALKVFLEAIKSTVGIILITGPTGSGKTRTLASTLIKINNENVNIVTLEDPVEIRVPGVNQVQINPQVGLTFANGLRSILRQDPNIIMVGEIRDTETAQLAVQAALTGHLVLATLHTNTAPAALPRLVDMGIENYLLASTIKVVVAQRLVRTICPYCTQEIEITPELISDINSVMANIDGFDTIKYLEKRSKQPNNPDYYKPINNQNYKAYMYKGKGCDKCNNTGYIGRIGIFEVLSMNEIIGRILMKNKPTSEIEVEAIRQGMITMKQDGYLKALDGMTTLEEVLRVVNM